MRLILLVLIITALAYLPIFGNQFVGDDPDFILNWKTIQSFEGIGSLLKGEVPVGHEGVYRPIRSLVYLWMHILAGDNEFGYHLFSLLVHLLSTVLIYGITTKLFANKVLAGVTTLLFGLHPVHVESITWITGSFDAFGFMLFFATYYLFLCFTQTKKNRDLYLMWTLSGLAFFSEELTLTLPLLIVLTYLTLKRSSFEAKSVKKALLGIGVIAGVYLLVRFSLHTPARGYYLAGSFWLTIASSLKAFFVYVSVALFPFVLTLDHTIPPNLPTFTHRVLINQLVGSQPSIDIWLICAITIFFGLLLFILKTYRQYPLLPFCLGWFFIALLPVSNIIPSYTLMREMYMYIASFSICLGYAYLLKYLIDTKRLVGIGMIIGITLFYFGRTFIRNFDWKDEIRLWQATAETSPSNPLVYYKLGSAYQENKNYQQAISAYERSLELNTSLAFVDYNLGTVYAAQENHLQAIKYYDSAILKDNQIALYYLGKAQSDFKQENYLQAWDSVEIAQRSSVFTDSDKKASYSLAIAIGNKLIEEDFYLAEIVLSKAIEMTPNNPEAYIYLGSLYGKYGIIQKARDNFDHALSLDPENQLAQDAMNSLILKVE